jgi:hypothetical protein
VTPSCDKLTATRAVPQDARDYLLDAVSARRTIAVRGRGGLGTTPAADAPSGPEQAVTRA